MAARVGPRSLAGLFKQGCTEIPEIMGGIGLALIGFVIQGFAIRKHIRNDGDNHKYKYNYIIMRSNDPRVAKVRKD